MKLYKKIIIYLLLIILSVVFLVPIYTIVSLSFKTQKEVTFDYWGLPDKLSFENFDYVWNRPTMGLKYYFLNSIKISIPTLIMVVLLSLLGAYPLSKFQLGGQKVLITFLILGITLPYQIIIIPIFKMVNFMHLYDTIFGLILIHIGIWLPFCIFLLRNYLTQVPKDMIDAAMVDGCSHFGILFKIILPISTPAIAVISILVFTWVFNEFFYGLIIGNTVNSAPVTVSVAFLKDSVYSVYWNYQAAGALIISIPTLVVFLAFQRFFIKGIMLGSVKG